MQILLISYLFFVSIKLIMLIVWIHQFTHKVLFFPINIAKFCPFCNLTHLPTTLYHTHTHTIHVSCGSWGGGGMNITCFFSVLNSPCLGPPIQHEGRKDTCRVGGEEGRPSVKAVTGDLILLCWAMILLGDTVVVLECELVSCCCSNKLPQS